MAPSSPHHVRLTPETRWLDFGLRELFQYRELLAMFTWRLIAVQYKQSLIGIGWAIINPLVTTIVFSVIFGVLASIPSDGQPYPLFVLSGLALWQYFARSIGTGSNSLVANAGIVTKVYFPRVILPLSGVLAGLVDLTVTFLLLFALMLYYGIVPSGHIVTLPLFVLLTIFLATGVSLWLSALNALYRDVGFVVPFMIQIWMYMTPIIYPAHLVPEAWRWLFYFNPMAAVIEGARWSIVGGTPPTLTALSISCTVTAVVLFGGIGLFRRIESVVADRI